jgi:hypothetical protein
LCKKADVNIFTFLIFLGGIGAVITFVLGVKAMLRHGEVGHRSGLEWMSWHFLFEVATFATILAAPLSRTP